MRTAPAVVHDGPRECLCELETPQREVKCTSKGWLAGAKVRLEDDRVYALTTRERLNHEGCD
jgi:hypothetical protein